MSQPKKIALLGGSFNPSHLGHVAIARHVLANAKADQVWVIPCWEHPLGKELEPFAHRLAMCHLAFAPLGDRVEVLEIEKELGGKSYTYRTVRHLQTQHPKVKWILVLGEDAAGEVKTWACYEDLKRALEWYVIPRGATSPIPNVSATQIRENMSSRKKLEQWLPQEVIEYIKKHQLYKNLTK